MANSDIHDIAILFIHHELDEITLNNFSSFKRLNPGIPIVPLSSTQSKINGGFGCDDLPGFQKARAQYPGGEWMYRSGLDVLVVEWFRWTNLRSRRWFLVEWDGWCGLPIRSFLTEVWDFDLAVPSVRWPNREPDWCWFRQIQRLPVEYRKFAVGAVPTCFTMLSNRALEAVANQLHGDLLGYIIYELRMPTLANAAGYSPVAIPRAGSNVSWLAHPATTLLTPTLWHPIKWLAPPVVP